MLRMKTKISLPKMPITTADGNEVTDTSKFLKKEFFFEKIKTQNLKFEQSTHMNDATE